MRDYPRDGGAVKQLIYLYPSLQFVVPVHIDNWDSQFIPPVTFIPENYDEHLNQSITAFKGAKKLNILTTSEPSFPVIVIGLNERIGKGVRSTEPPILDITLKGDDFESGIRLEWDFNSFENEIDGYHIFRKEAGQQNFVHIGENPTLENKIFNDVSVTANKSYSYYVRAFNNFGMSMASNIVTITAPDYPATAASFSATHFEIDYNELRWVHLPANYVETTRLSRRIVDVENDYSVIYEAAPEEESYIDNIDAYGKTVLYKLEEITNIGESSPKFDIVKLPYRNIAEPSALILSTYSYLDVDELEHWIYGKPEFAITAVRAGSDGEIEVVEKRLEIYFKNRRQKNDVYDFAPDSNSEPHTTYIADWYPTDFLDTYTINIVEFDNAPKIDLTLSASYEYKDTVATGFTGFVQGSVKTTIEDILNSRDEEIGKAEVRYYDPTNHILKYGQNEFQIQIRD